MRQTPEKSTVDLVRVEAQGPPLLEVDETCLCGGRLRLTVASLRTLGLARTKWADWNEEHQGHSYERVEQMVSEQVETLGRKLMSEIHGPEMPPLPVGHLHYGSKSQGTGGEYGRYTLEEFMNLKPVLSDLIYGAAVTTDGRLASRYVSTLGADSWSWTLPLIQSGIVCCVRVVVPGKHPALDTFLPVRDRLRVNPGDTLDFDFKYERA